MRKDPANAVKRANFKKATQIRQAGFKSSIHALPPNVKAELDQLLSWEVSVPEAMKTVSAKYPDVKFPSVRAVEMYRKKYIEGNRPKDVYEAVKGKTELIEAKAALEKSGVARLKRIDTDILPAIEAELMRAIKFSTKASLPIVSPIIQLSGAYKDLLKVYHDILRGNDAHLFLEDTVEGSLTSEEEYKVKEEELDAEIDDVLRRRRVQIQFKRTKKVFITKKAVS